MQQSRDAIENTSGEIDVEKEMKVDKGNLYDAMVSSAFDDFKTNLVYRMGIGAEPKPKPNDEDTSDVEIASANVKKTVRSAN